MRAHGLPEYELPILVKLIDARQDLSIQVHPDDEFASRYENGQLGKTEMWYVLDATGDASLIYGLHRDTEEAELRASLEQGTVLRYLQRVRVHKNDVFYIPAGTIHAIGAGALVAEVQENSNLTYRLYDYDRIDRNGQKRAFDKALAAANLQASASPVQPMRVLKYRRGIATELLCRCRYFMVERMLLNTERCREMVTLQTGSTSFEALLCVDGCGVLQWETGHIPFFKGDCIFLPADSEQLRLHGSAQILKIMC